MRDPIATGATASPPPGRRSRALGLGLVATLVVGGAAGDERALKAYAYASTGRGWDESEGRSGKSGKSDKSGKSEGKGGKSEGGGEVAALTKGGKVAKMAKGVGTTQGTTKGGKDTAHKTSKAQKGGGASQRSERAAATASEDAGHAEIAGRDAPAAHTPCLTEESCDAAQEAQGLDGFYTGDFQTKGCFRKGDRAFFAPGTIEEMSVVELPGVQERVYC